MIEHLQERSRTLLTQHGVRSETHPTWTAGSGWKVFLDHPEEVWRTIRYIERNPVKIGLPVQTWAFVKPYDNWPLHPGHSPNSPYTVRLRKLGRYP